MKFNYKLMRTIMELGKDLSSINLMINVDDRWSMIDFIIDYIIEGCPKLKSLTLESLRGWEESPKPKMTKYLSNLLDIDLDEIPSHCHTISTLKDLDFFDFWDLIITEDSLEALHKRCKELKDLKLTKVTFEDIFTEDEVKKILPECNVEIKESQFDDLDDASSWMSDDSHDSYGWFSDVVGQQKSGLVTTCRVRFGLQPLCFCRVRVITLGFSKFC